MSHMAKRILATKFDILEFIMKTELIQRYQLEEKFGYSPKSVGQVLNRLKKAGLLINMTRDRWEVTTVGYDKMRYHGRR